MSVTQLIYQLTEACEVELEIKDYKLIYNTGQWDTQVDVEIGSILVDHERKQVLLVEGKEVQP